MASTSKMPNGDGFPARYDSPLCSPWATVDDIPDSYRNEHPDISEAEWMMRIAYASEILWALSGRRWFGEGCTDTASSAPDSTNPGQYSWPWSEFGCGCNSGSFVGPPWSGVRARSTSVHPVALPLPREDVVSVKVAVNGGPLDDGAYRLSGGYITQIDGKVWNVCRDQITVEMSWGSMPPLAGVVAVIDYARELVRSTTGDCELPDNVSAVTRQGVSYTLEDVQTATDNGTTGVLTVDRWLAAVNPLKRQRRAVAFIPDLPRLY